MFINEILNLIVKSIYKLFKNSNVMAQNMRSPKDFFYSFIAKRIMLIANQKVIEDSVRRLRIRKNDIVLEIGSGNGQAIEEILKQNPKKIKVIEISPVFRNILIKKFNDKIELFENDASNLKKVINSNSIDKILLINVIYFLKPLDKYLKEFERILKSTGLIFIAAKFDAVKDFDSKVFKNKNIQDLLKVFNKYFKVSYKFLDLGDDNSKYCAICLTKI